jgi:hypothetical protein
MGITTLRTHMPSLVAGLASFRMPIAMHPRSSHRVGQHAGRVRTGFASVQTHARSKQMYVSTTDPWVASRLMGSGTPRQRSSPDTGHGSPWSASLVPPSSNADSHDAS